MVCDAWYLREGEFWICNQMNTLYYSCCHRFAIQIHRMSRLGRSGISSVTLNHCTSHLSDMREWEMHDIESHDDGGKRERIELVTI